MSHYFESGFTVREPAWHGLAKVLSKYPGDWDEARRLAGLDWEPVSEPVYALSGMDLETATPVYDRIEGWQRITRSDTGATLSVNKQTYQIIGHGEMGEIVEAVLVQPNVKYETAGVLEEGRAVWVLAYLDEPITLPGDESLTLPYLTILNRHDGTAACKLIATAVRVVCANTFKAAEMEGERTGAVYSFVHRGGWRDRIRDAREVITGARREIDRYRELATELLGVRVGARQRERFVVEFLPVPPDGLISDRVSRNIAEARDAVRSILAGPTCDGIAGTAYGLVQAAGEYLDHGRAYRTRETYLGRTLLRPEELKRRALKLALSVAGS